MMKILVAVDGTSKGLEAVSILGRLIKHREDLSVVLLHCVQQVASLLPGDLCRDLESSCRFAPTDQKKIGNAVLMESLHKLTRGGFPEEKVELRLQTDSMDPAQDILATADKEEIRTIVVGRRGRSQVEDLLLGSVSLKVAQYARGKTVWVIDTPVHETGKVLVALEGIPESSALSEYTAAMAVPADAYRFTFLHLMPPVPPTFWDNGHILDAAEQKDRLTRMEKWKTDWLARVNSLMSEARELLLARKIPGSNIDTMILPTREGIARDLLGKIKEHEFQIVVMGKRSFRERKPFLMGSHAAKILHNAKGTVLCLVD